MKNIYALLGLLVFSGCGTFNSLAKKDSEIARHLQKVNTNCSVIPRIYGGVAYDLCLVNSNPDSLLQTWHFKLRLFDTIPSAALDTVVLPYSVYSQIHDGSIKVKKD